jgi:hypothetical protein
MIASFELNPNDILVVRVPVGAMPPTRVKEFLETVKANMKEHLGQDQKVLMFAAREGDLELAILKRPA